MAKNFIAGPAIVDVYKGSQLIATAKTLLDSSINISSSNEEVRGGQGNSLWGKYYHTSAMDITLTELMFKLEYIAWQTGSSIVTGADYYTSEQVTITEEGKGSVTGTPVAFGDYGIVGFATKAGEDVYTTVTFTGKQFTMAGVKQGDIVCVKYVENNVADRYLTVSSDFVPETVHLVMTANLYAGGKNLSDSTLSGTIQVDVPRFQFNGSQEISMTATGVANTPLSGSALSNESEGCEGTGYYATITEHLTGAHWYDNVIQLAVSGGDVEMSTSDGTVTLTVLAIPVSGSAFVAPNADLTFTSKTPSIASVGDHTGIITATTAGTTGISIVITNKPSVEGATYVTVS